MVGDAPRYRVGVDVGGTKVLAVALTASTASTSSTAGSVAPEVLAEAEAATVKEDAAAILEVIGALVDSLAGDLGEAPTSIGVGMPGLVDRSGVLRTGPHLPGTTDLDVAAALSDRHCCPVVVDNDGNCAARAEQALGAGAPSEDLVFIGLGTGISCGLVVAGAGLRGAHGFAGEPGHMTLLPGGPSCACGRRGCWETLASGTALAAQARRAVLDDPPAAAALLGLAGGSLDELRGEHVTAALRAGDPLANRVADTFAGWVGMGVANVVQLLDPATVVLGGSVLTDPVPWLGRIDAAYRRSVQRPDLRAASRLLVARLGRRAGAVGAALLGSG
jgi:glucokinase